MEVEEKTAVIENEENIPLREESVPPVEQEVVTADCIEETVIDDNSTAIEMKQEAPAAIKKPASQRGKRKSTAGISKRDGGSGVPRRRSTVKQRNASSSQNKGTKKNSRQQSQYVIHNLNKTCV